MAIRRTYGPAAGTVIEVGRREGKEERRRYEVSRADRFRLQAQEAQNAISRLQEGARLQAAAAERGADLQAEADFRRADIQSARRLRLINYRFPANNEGLIRRFPEESLPSTQYNRFEKLDIQKLNLLRQYLQQ